MCIQYMRRGPYTDHANRRQVLEASGIDENKKMVTSATTSMRAHGFYIGAKVTLKWRISKNFTPDKYCDINVGEVGFIKGEKDNSKKADSKKAAVECAIVTFSKQIGKKEVESDIQVPYENLILYEPDSAHSIAADGEGVDGVEAKDKGMDASGMPKGYGFLKVEGDDGLVQVVKNWEKLQARGSETHQLRMLHHAVGTDNSYGYECAAYVQYTFLIYHSIVNYYFIPSYCIIAQWRLLCYIVKVLCIGHTHRIIYHM